MARADVFRLLLIRSGTTDWDEHEHLSGAADHPLCEHGLARFGISPEQVGDVEFRSVLCAEDQASRQSAEIVAEALGGKVRACSRLGDADLGLWQGLRMDEMRERSPRIYKQWADDPLSLSPPEGEPLREAVGSRSQSVRGGTVRAEAHNTGDAAQRSVVGEGLDEGLGFGRPRRRRGAQREQDGDERGDRVGRRSTEVHDSS